MKIKFAIGVRPAIPYGIDIVHSTAVDMSGLRGQTCHLQVLRQILLLSKLLPSHSSSLMGSTSLYRVVYLPFKYMHIVMTAAAYGHKRKHMYCNFSNASTTVGS